LIQIEGNTQEKRILKKSIKYLIKTIACEKVILRNGILEIFQMLRISGRMILATR